MAKDNEKVEATNLEDMQKKMEAMKEEIIAQANEEAAQIIAKAKATANGELTEKQKKASEKEKKYYNELVEIELFKDNGKYKDDVFVAVNGVGMIVPRGIKTKIPRKYALALEDSMKQDRKTSDFIQMKVREYEEAEKNI